MSSPSAQYKLWHLGIYVGNESSVPLRLKVDRVATIGRQDATEGFYPDLDLAPYGGRDHGVSRRHAQFAVVNGALYLIDLGSVNGTRLNGQKLNPHEPQVIRHGDQVECGKLRMIVYLLDS